MPNFLHPRKSGAHRIAAIALYRALLTQCRALPPAIVESQQRLELQNIVRTRFKQARHLSSNRWMKLTFEAGYEAIDRLDAAVAGDEEGGTYILGLLEKAPERIKQTPPTTLTKRQLRLIRQRQRDANPASADEQEQKPKKPSIFDRPLPLDQLSGRRHVPVFFNAQGLPVLRIKKPQPQSLSTYINGKLKQKQKWDDERHRLDDELDLARAEDAWDRIIAAENPGVEGSCGSAEREPNWQAALFAARQDIFDKMTAQRRRNVEVAARMQEVVVRERELFEKERKERREKRREWLLAKREGEKSGWKVSGLDRKSAQADESRAAEDKTP
jgi:hypothetical protein